ncbi:MAG: tRNA uridine-5-carboxymethylaminomethyl(34) synthesis GTPase MnmE [Bacilli bacterium]|nr:tRNA uridine-5-carboxymethylaminomethyl(34) synthesis GTPase MnmE [Bacilli bacterium]
MLDDTIVGISTTVGRGAISIVRLSGPQSIELVSKIFKGKDLTKAKTHTIHYGYIYNYETKETIDEVLVSIFKKPKTYTKEDLVEINCHGGQLVTQMVVEQLVMLGARIAQAGEFTRRAFLNGRIDLAKAEAVMDIIDAENKNALKMANQGITGELSAKIKEERQKLLNVIMQIAVNIDYPEYDDVVELTKKEIYPILDEVLNDIDALLQTSKDAVKIKNGINTALVGKPNVGKSSLLNALLQDNRAIVTEIPGTTRDVIEAKLNLGGFALNLIDTAGIRETEDVIEKIGVIKSKEKIEEADLILMIFDGSREIEAEDLEILNSVRDKKHICIVNKSDLEQKIDLSKIPNAIIISTKDSNSIKVLSDEISKQIFEQDINLNTNIYISNARQISKLVAAKDSLNKAIEDIRSEQFIDFIELSIKEAWISLGEILGEVKDTELLDELFSRFCLGK